MTSIRNKQPMFLVYVYATPSIIRNGFSKRKPIGDNRTEFGRRLNRRTEVIIIEK